MIVIIDYGISNLKSVKNILEVIGAEVIISNKKEDIEKAERIILPGVGSFDEGIGNLEKLGLIEILRKEVLEKKKPFLGICLGMQLLATKGNEGRENKGLNFIPGEVKRLKLKKEFKVPHVGWDDIIIKKETPLFNGMTKDKNFYFVHSYYFIPESDECIVATCNYDKEFVCAIQKGNIFATQFHPEKSQINGMKFMENFIKWKP
jgi:glutamine amidotransferase